MWGLFHSNEIHPAKNFIIEFIIFCRVDFVTGWNQVWSMEPFVCVMCPHFNKNNFEYRIRFVSNSSTCTELLKDINQRAFPSRMRWTVITVVRHTCWKKRN